MTRTNDIGKSDGSWSLLLIKSIRVVIFVCMIGCSRCDSQRSTVSVFVTWAVGVYCRTKGAEVCGTSGAGRFLLDDTPDPSRAIPVLSLARHDVLVLVFDEGRMTSVAKVKGSCLFQQYTQSEQGSLVE
jgi:hypothetical protein